MKPYHYDHVRKINIPEEWQIFACVTRAEAANLWDKWPSTVQNHIDNGRLVARKSGSIWLVSIDSLYHLWGKPPEPQATTSLWWTWCKIDTILKFEALPRSDGVGSTGA